MPGCVSTVPASGPGAHPRMSVGRPTRGGACFRWRRGTSEARLAPLLSLGGPLKKVASAISSKRRVFGQISPRWFRVWVYFAAYTGVRWSEMLGVRRKDVDLLRRTVTIERQLLEVQSRFLGFGPPKS